MTWVERVGKPPGGQLWNIDNENLTGDVRYELDVTLVTIGHHRHLAWIKDIVQHPYPCAHDNALDRVRIIRNFVIQINLDPWMLCGQSAGQRYSANRNDLDLNELWVSIRRSGSWTTQRNSALAYSSYFVVVVLVFVSALLRQSACDRHVMHMMNGDCVDIVDVGVRARIQGCRCACKARPRASILWARTDHRTVFAVGVANGVLGNPLMKVNVFNIIVVFVIVVFAVGRIIVPRGLATFLFRVILEIDPMGMLCVEVTGKNTVGVSVALLRDWKGILVENPFDMLDVLFDVRFVYVTCIA